MSDGIYLFLQNVQIATMIVSFVSILLCIVALVFFIIMMFYGIKVAKIYIKEHGSDKKETVIPVSESEPIANKDEKMESNTTESLEEKEK